jgi:hypothetical protein
VKRFLSKPLRPDKKPMFFDIGYIVALVFQRYKENVEK